MKNTIKRCVFGIVFMVLIMCLSVAGATLPSPAVNTLYQTDCVYVDSFKPIDNGEYLEGCLEIFSFNFNEIVPKKFPFIITIESPLIITDDIDHIEIGSDNHWQRCEKWACCDGYIFIITNEITYQTFKNDNPVYIVLF